MKKKLFIFLLTCIIISTLAIVLVGCGDENADKEPDVGTFTFSNAEITSKGGIDTENTLKQFIEAQKDKKIEIYTADNGQYMVNGVKLNTKIEGSIATMTVNVEDIVLTLPENSEYKIVSEQYVLEKDVLIHAQKWENVNDKNKNYTIISTFLKDVPKTEKD